MGLNLQNLRDSLRKSTGEDITDLPDTEADLLLNRSFWEIIDKLPFREKEKTCTFVTVPGSALYAVPTNFEAIRTASIEIANTLEHVTLKLMTIQTYEDSYQNQTYAQAQPEWYLRENNYVRLFPTPDAIYTVTLKYNMSLSDLTPALAIPIQPVWHEIIEFGGTWRRFKELNDYGRMKEIRQLQRELIGGITPTEAKEKADTKFAGLSVPYGRGYNY